MPPQSRDIAAKRRASEESTPEGSGKRKRTNLSCVQCTKRKQKCNREYPCEHCIARRVPHLCVPYNPQSSKDPGVDPTTAARLDALENLTSILVRHHGGLWGYDDVKTWLQSNSFLRLFPPTSSSPSAQSDFPAPSEARLHARAPLSPSNLRRMESAGATNGHGGDHRHEEDPRDCEAGQDGDGSEEGLGGGVKKGWMRDLDGGVPESMNDSAQVHMKLDIHGTPAENLQRLITECGMSPHKLAELLQELPPKAFADRVVEFFFQKINPTRYMLEEGLFRESYEDLYDKSAQVDPANVRALPLVFIVLALAVRLAPAEWAGDDQQRKLSSLRMYWSSRRSILVATAVQSESLELVITRLLSAMYLVLMHDRRLTECWSQLGASLRTAQAIGLHRDGTKLGLDPYQTEYRRRIWAYLYYADRHYSLILGRPPSISDSYTDCLPPSNIDLSQVPRNVSATDPRLVPQPFDEPNVVMTTILRKKLSTITGSIVHHFQKLDEPARYSDVQELHQQIQRFIDDLPKHYRLQNPDRSLDNELFWLPINRFMLLTEVLLVIIILHRPWLLRRLSSDEYLFSRTACFEAAKMDFTIRQEFQLQVPDFRLYAITGQFKMFNSAMIAGISAIVDPRGPDGDQMRKILTTFLEQNPWTEARGKDETTRKEVQIIQTLSRRAAQIYEASFAPGELTEAERDSVNLLLSLQGGDQAADVAETERVAASRRVAESVKKARKSTAELAATQVRQSVDGIRGAQALGPGQQGQQQSPADKEDDHSQRLLDNWLNANSSLSIPAGSSGLPSLEGSSVFQKRSNYLGHFPSFGGSGGADGTGSGHLSSGGMIGSSSWPGVASSGPMATLPTPGQPLGGSRFGGLNGMGPHGELPLDFDGYVGPGGGGAAADGGSGGPAGALSGTGPFGGMMGPAQVEVGVGLNGSGVGLGSMGAEEDGGTGGSGESDEYWNALIDGILGTTGGGLGQNV